ncbi:LLM class flavin-dependent oxidoreductase [Metabacillus sp. RGM 3146]|uniref:LLM class flavin-dependent oxidoreductase n=1 Tax=Metabacillus sp. RGM 3146 TaxID=3401092 RepID=UPI003B9CEC2F
MNLSILDQSPILSGMTARDALRASVELAKAGETLGYTRYWIAEHHNLSGLACPSPEVMLGILGENTTSIRIGSGAVLLPNYRPYKVAESFNLLSTLFPGRVDLGIGRAPGGSAEASIALSGNFLKNVAEMPDRLKELLSFLYNNFPESDLNSKISASPLPSVPPKPWLLGTSEKSALLAGKNGTAYAFGHFMSDKDGAAIVKSYKDTFIPNEQLQKSEAIVTVSAICAETSEQAEDLAKSFLVWQIQQLNGLSKCLPALGEAKKYFLSADEKQIYEKMKKKIIIGNPAQVKQQLLEIQTSYNVDEIMIVSITPSYEKRIRSYSLIAEECL